MSSKSKIQSKIVAITGATASGKTKLALDLASELGGEIINADSVQVYQELDIGSAKPSLEEQAIVKHYLLSYLKPDESNSAGRFRKDCFKVIDRLINSNVLPILTGGSGLYLSSLFSNFLDDNWVVANTDKFLSEVRSSKSAEDYLFWSQKLLEVLDPVSNKKLAINDLFRRERALTLSLSLGAPASALKHSLSSDGESLSGLVIILERERNSLYKRINNRVNSMIQNGLIEEVQNLIVKYGQNAPSLRAIGYAQVVNYLNEEKQGVTPAFEDLIKIIQRDTRRFAKRQLTWWRNQPSKLAWVDVLKLPCFESVISDSPHLKFSVGEDLVVGSYADLKSFLKYVIEKYTSDELVELSEATAFTKLVYICRVQCLD